MVDSRPISDADGFFHESMERLAGALGVTFEGQSIDWVAGTDPIAPLTPPGPQILTTHGWRPLSQTTPREA